MDKKYWVILNWHRPLDPGQIVVAGDFSTNGEECSTFFEYKGKKYHWGPLTDIPDYMAAHIGTARIYYEVTDKTAGTMAEEFDRVQEQHKPESITTIVADIRNKLTPLCNLAAMTKRLTPNNTEITRMLRREAVTALEYSEIIRKQLEKIIKTDYRVEDVLRNQLGLVYDRMRNASTEEDRIHWAGFRQGIRDVMSELGITP
jgi:hypothetical protein